MGAGQQTTVSDVKNKQGGAAETVRPIQDKAMLSVAERPSEGKSKQEVLDFLYEGIAKIRFCSRRCYQIFQVGKKKGQLHVA